MGPGDTFLLKPAAKRACPADAWRLGKAAIYIFEAQVFSDHPE